MKTLIALALLFIFALGMAGCGSKAYSIGIIGGADGPTAIFVTSSTNWQDICALIAIILLTLVIILVIRHNKKKK